MLSPNAKKGFQLLMKLRIGFNYMNNHPDKVEENTALISRAKPIIDELHRLGMPREISEKILLTGKIQRRQE